jgi:membrane protein required for colicin V production
VELSALDFVFGVVLLLAAVRCAFRGFIAEIMSMAALILGIGLAVLFSSTAAGYLEPYLGVSLWNQVIGFLGIFLLVYLVVKIFEGALHRLFENVHLERLDRALGFVLGVAEGLLVVSIAIILIYLQPFVPPERIVGNSVVTTVILRVLPLTEMNFTL